MSTDTNAQPAKRGKFARMLPGLALLKSYELAWLRPDIVAGITLAAYLLPAAIADSSLAQLPPQAGIYACLFGGLAFWLFCSSRHTAITVTSAISLLIGATLGEMGNGDTSRFGALAACTALMVAGFSLLVWLFDGGSIVNFVSETVMLGFKAGVALHLASTQLPKFLGISGAHGNFWNRMGQFFAHLGEMHAAALWLGLAALTVLVLGKIFVPTRPVALVVVISGIVAASLLDLGAHGVKLLGEVPKGLPVPALPAVGWSDMDELLSLAMAAFLLAAVETAAIARMFAQKHGYRVDTNQEFLALAGANLAAGLGQGYPVSGGMSQSVVNESGGARTPISGLIAALLTLLVALFFTGLLRDLPQPVLAAIVLVAVMGLFKVKALVRLWHFSRTEFAIAAAALLGVLSSGLLRGVMIGAVLSILVLLRRASRPLVTELGRIPGTDQFADRVRDPRNEREPGVFVFRNAGGLFFFNIDHVRDRFFELMNERGDTRCAIYFMGAVPLVDLAGAELLIELFRTLKSRGIEFRLAGTSSSVREILMKAGYEHECGPVVANETVNAAIAGAAASARATVAQPLADAGPRDQDKRSGSPPGDLPH
jgi:sulfate permease, SulP family